MYAKTKELGPIGRHVPGRHAPPNLLMLTIPLADPGGTAGMHPPPPPQQDPILSFSHMFLPKITHVRGWCPPNSSVPPQWEILDLPLHTKVWSKNANHRKYSHKTRLKNEEVFENHEKKQVFESDEIIP